MYTVRGLCTHTVSQYSMSHLMSQDNDELVNVCNSLHHSRKDVYFSILHKGKYSSNISHVLFEDLFFTGT